MFLYPATDLRWGYHLKSLICNFGFGCLLYPRSTEGGMGVYLIYPRCLSVRPSVCRQGFRNFLKKTIGSIHFIPGIYPYGVSLLTPIHFCVPSLIVGSLGAKHLAENGVSGTFWKKKLFAQFISYLAFTHKGWVSWPLYVVVFLASFSALWWPNIWPKMGFPELFEKTIGPIHFIPGIYPYGVSLLTLIHFLDEVGSDQSGGILSHLWAQLVCTVSIWIWGSQRLDFWLKNGEVRLLLTPCQKL